MDQEQGNPSPSGEANGSAPGGSVRTYLKAGEEFIDELLSENERLRLRVVQLESQLFMDKTPVPPPAAADQLRRLFSDLEREHNDLSEQLNNISSETENYKARYQQIEEENDRLVNLFVAAHQLHSTIDLSEVVTTIVEILLNFVGAGRFAIYVLDETENKLYPLEAYGVPLVDVPALANDAEAIAGCLSEGRPTVVEGVTDQWSLEQPRVCIPLRLGEHVMGVVTIYSYLEQKHEITPIDRELFNLIADHAGSVLEAARLFAAKPGEAARTIGAYQSLLNVEGSHE